MTLNNESRLRASALRLRFGELWQTVANEIDTNPAAIRRNPRNLKFEYFPELSEDVTLRVLEFLDAKSLARVSATCHTLRTFIKTGIHLNYLWTRHYEHASNWLCILDEAGTNVKRKYLKLLLLYHEAELRHHKNLYKLSRALCLMPKGSVVNIVGNIGNFADAAVAVAVSAKRQVALSTVILSRTQDAIIFRKVTDYVGPVSFYSQDNISPLLGPLEMPSIEAKGFIGYAVNLIRLDPKDEYMRYTFLLCTYKNLTVWESLEDEAAARASSALPAHVLSVALDTFAGRKTSALSLWYRTGHFPASPTAFPCFVAVGKNRPKPAHQEDVTAHINCLESTRDNLREALAHFEE